ncbi:hypothetical protein OU5_5653 [Pseudomonas mandelii JR-1]|uniref:Uncharacterized protein n=1 Tax=Pseudomonas mandelii JR-1 TaxID=1147786 RepID=A0A024EIW1_9PSED|nr:hypothetical protein OU5_5653 [Pseudomonas mandelii JR-1]
MPTSGEMNWGSGVHIALCERTRYFVNVLKKSKTTKKGPPFGEPF